MFESSREPASAAVRRHRGAGALRSGVSVAALGAALAAGLALGPCPAWADGGAGRTPGGAAGGVDGTLASATGQSGTVGTSNGGGGGGVDLTTGAGAPGGAGGTGLGETSVGIAGAAGSAGQTVTGANSISTAVSGGVGGAGGADSAGAQAGGGGGGGVGVNATADVTITSTGSVTGGAGGAQGSGGSAGGGGGGVGVFSSANVTVESGGSIKGGAGGAGGSGGSGGAAAAVVLTGGGTVQNGGTLLGGLGGGFHGFGATGDGGAGVQLLAGGTVINTGSISGGAGGSNLAIRAGRGGAGIEGANVTVVNSGAITGGAGGATLNPVQAAAINFTGGVNSLELQAGSQISGNVIAFSAADTFRLGGDAAASFNVSTIGAQYQGFGVYQKTGASTWTLTGTTSALTAWTITGGALAISSDASLGDPSGGVTFNGGGLETTADITTARSMVLTGAGTFDTDVGTTLTLTTAVTGAGALTRAGGGTLVLAADAAYAGGTTISAGTLQLGAGGTTGSISGDVADNGTLAFDRSDAVTFGGVISGTGSVSQIGAGTTTLSAVNTYAGGTTVTGGTLTGSATSFGSGSILDNAALVIDQPSDAEFADAIDGTGDFTKTGAGNLTYTAAGSLTGPTTVAAGQLTVNGSLAASAVTVLSGATLGGSGTVGATTIQAGGTIAPGGANVLHVNGAFAQAAGSTYQATLDPNSNASSRIAVTGAATLAASAGLNVTKSQPGNFRVGAVYTVLSATGGLNGTYALSGDIMGISAFLGLKDSYDANNAYLTVVQTASPASAAQTSNQSGVASGLPSGGDVTTAVLNSQSGAAARSAFNELSGDGHAATQGVLVNDSRLVRDLAIDRLQSLFCAPSPSDQANHRVDGACVEDNDHTAAWGQAFGAWGHTDGNGNAGNVSRSTGGLLMGIDRPLADWRLGGFLGYSHTSLTLDARTGSGEIDSYHVGLYGGRRFGAWGFEFGGAYTDEEISSKRVVVLPDFFNRLSADYGGQTLQGFAQVDWRTSAGPVELEPFAGLAYVAVHTDHFVETGGEAALSAEGDTTGQMFSTLGVRPSINLVIDQWQATLHGVLGWRHDFSQNTPTTNVRFVAGGDPFTVEGVPLTRDAAVGEVSLDMRATSAATVSLTYGVEGAGGDVDQTVRANFHVAF